MGLFDYVKCEVGLPDGKANDCEFQTKDFDCPYMETYTITAQGRLVHNAVRYDIDPPDKRTGSIDMNFHGYLNFYGGDDGEWREFNAKFTDGQLIEIVKIPDEPAMTPDEQELHDTLAAVLRAIEEQNPVIRQGSFDLPFRNYEAVVKARELMKLRSADRE